MTATNIAHQAAMPESSADFLSFLRSKFDDEEAHTFFTSFALTLQGKNEEFCIDLDEAYRWIGYTQKVKAVELIERVKLVETVDFNVSRTGNITTAPKRGQKPIKYFLKPSAFKHLLLAAQTDASKKAAEYFIKIEEALPEFFKQGGTSFAPLRASDWKALPIGDYTARLTFKKPEEMIVSAGYNEDMSDPKAYFMRSGECTYPPGLVPEGAMVIDFGQTSDSRKRRADYERRTGVGEFLEHFPSPDPIRLERSIRRLAELEGRLVYGRRSDGTKTCEQAYVTSQADYNGFAAKVYREQQKIIVEYCKLQAEREKRLTAEVELEKLKMELSKEREKTLQEKEKTEQMKEQVHITANEAEIERQKTIQMKLQLGLRHGNDVLEAGNDRVEDAESPEPNDVTEESRDDNDPYSDYRAEALEQCSDDIGLRWSDVLAHFRTWHDKRFQSLPKGRAAKELIAVRKYFERHIGKIGDVQPAGQKKMWGVKGWRLRSAFLQETDDAEGPSRGANA